MFLRRADFNESEPICKSMYCDRKYVINSDRIDESEKGPLPGPQLGSEHGSCINYDGQILSHIINFEDCACFRHKSCDNCAKDVNCQWCGYSKPDGLGGVCYSNKTHLSICDVDSVSDDRGGSCKNVKTNKDADNEPTDGWTRESCEGENICVNETYWNTLEVGQTESTDNKLGGSDSKYTSSTSREDCISSNEKFDEHAQVTYPDKCVLTNNELTELTDVSANTVFKYYHLSQSYDNNATYTTTNESTSPTIKISDTNKIEALFYKELSTSGDKLGNYSLDVDEHPAFGGNAIIDNTNTIFGADSWNNMSNTETITNIQDNFNIQNKTNVVSNTNKLYPSANFPQGVYDNKVQLKITEKICVPKENATLETPNSNPNSNANSNANSSANNVSKYSYCVNQNDKESCEFGTDNRCEYITNPLRDICI